MQTPRGQWFCISQTWESPSWHATGVTWSGSLDCWISGFMNAECRKVILGDMSVFFHSLPGAFSLANGRCLCRLYGWCVWSQWGSTCRFRFDPYPFSLTGHGTGVTLGFRSHVLKKCWDFVNMKYVLGPGRIYPCSVLSNPLVRPVLFLLIAPEVSGMAITPLKLFLSFF